MQLLRIALVSSLMLVNFCAPILGADFGNGASSKQPDGKLLHGSVNSVQRSQQASSSEENLRISRPSADATVQQVIPAMGAVKAGGAPLLNVNPPRDVNAPLLSVQELHRSTQPGFGLLGMYALCADSIRIPYYITNVFPSSELIHCGVESGDLLTRINGTSPFEYMHSTHPMAPGDTLTLTFEHHAIAKTVSVKLQDIQTFTPFFISYSQWAVSHVSFLKEHQGQYRTCGLF